MAVSAYMLGRDEDYVHGWLERAYRLYRDADEPVACLPLRVLDRPHAAVARGGGTLPAGGWAAHCACSSALDGDCVERGYLQIPSMFRP